MTTSLASSASSQQANIDAALQVLKSMGLSLDDLTAAPSNRPPVPTFACSFDHGLKPEICQPGTVAEVDGAISFEDGRIGKSLFVPRGARVSRGTAG